jgi:hypothetical protein
VVDDVFGTATDCQDPGNLIENCGFDTDLSGWDVFHPGFHSHVSTDGSSQPGCLELVAQSIGGTSYGGIFEQCVPISPNTTYVFGGYARVVSGSAGISCSFAGRVLTTSDCSGGPGVLAGGAFEATTSWSQSPAFSVTTIAAGGSISAARTVHLHMSCFQNSPFTLHFDDFFFRETSQP